MKCVAKQKTASWAVVSFFLILGIEVATHVAMHGSAGLRGFLATAGSGVFLACVLKTPVYFVHERIWHRRKPAPRYEPS